jgi:hypothetical protein
MAMANPPPRRVPGDDDSWAETRAAANLATRVMGDEEDYLATTRRAIGRRIDAEHHELFVVCDPAEALQLQFEHHAPEFIVLHDLGIDGAARLLQGVAAATQRPVQQLVVRRQGYGSALATLRFVELPAAGAALPVRIYSSHAETADPAQATALAQTLLGNSRLGVILVGAQAVNDAATRLRPLREALNEPAWRNRQLLWLPVGPEAAAAAPGSLVSRQSLVHLHTVAAQPDLGHAWALITGLWDRLRHAPQDPHAADGLGMPPMRAAVPVPGLPAVGAAHAAPHPAPHAAPHPAPQAAHHPASHRPEFQPSAIPDEAAHRGPAGSPPPLRSALSAAPVAPPVAPPAPAVDWPAYVRECAALPGMLSCCVFDLASERPLAHAGNRPGPAALAAQGAAMYEALCHSARSLGLAPGQPEMALTLAEHHLILHPLAQHPGLALHAVLDVHLANLTLVRMKLHRLDPGSPFAGSH